VCLPLALLTNVALLPRGFPYTALLLAQLVFYALACLPLVTRPSFRGAWRLPSYFVATNLAIALAWVRYLRGERFVFWQPSER
jgi:hypothetical protein